LSQSCITSNRHFTFIASFSYDTCGTRPDRTISSTSYLLDQYTDSSTTKTIRPRQKLYQITFDSLPIEITLSLPVFASSCHAEQKTTFQVPMYIKKNNFFTGQFLTVADSLSVMQSISNSLDNAKTSLAVSIISLYHTLNPIRIRVSLGPWSLGDSGKRYN